MCEDQDEQYSSEDDSDDPQTRKRATLTSDPIAKKKGRTNEVPLPSGTTLAENSVETAANPNPNRTTTKKHQRP